MNERIKELAERAEILFYQARINGYEYQGAEITVEDLEKFAELIVQECLDTIQRGIDNFGSANEDTLMGGRLALFYSYRNIQHRFGMGDYEDKQHFGVSE